MNLLFLNSVSTWEFLLIVAVVLMLFGSKGVPDIVKNLGKGMREIKAASDEIRRDIQESALEMRRDLNVPSIDDITKGSELNKELKEVEDLINSEDKPAGQQKTEPQAENPKA